MKLNTFYKYVHFIIMVIFLSNICSCKKFVDVGRPNAQIISEAVFSNDATANASVNGLYSRIMENPNSFLNGGQSLFPGLSSDELKRSILNANIDAFTTNTLKPENIVVSTLWNSAYNHIYHANACLEGLLKNTGVSPDLKNRLIGEVRLVRALCYFYLVNLFGDVPLVESTDFEINSRMPRTPAKEVWDMIIKDLKEAEVMLPETYAFAERIQPNKWAATALLARVYLFQKDFENAGQSASAVINSGMYTMPSIVDVFLQNSTEAIWQMMPVNPYMNTAEGNNFVAFSPNFAPIYYLTNELSSAFEPMDLRKENWMGLMEVNGQNYYYAHKYKIRTGGAPYTEYNMVLRLAEQYLIRAEAAAEIGDLVMAQSDLNVVRTRAGLPPTTAENKNELLQAIEQERRTEFFAEWGHRWFDLKRSGKIDEVLSMTKGSNWQTTDAFYPVPFSELQANPLLVQNPGY